MKPITTSIILAVAVSLGACKTGRVYTTSDSVSGFSYSLPETVVKIDLPVKFWVLEAKDDKGNATREDKGYLEIDPDVTGATTPIALEMDAYPASLSLVVLDQANNPTALDKFEVSYYTSGAEASVQSSGILKTINSEMTDKTADIVKNYTDTAVQLGKLAFNVAGFLQTTTKGTPVVLLRDRITASLPLRKGYAAINERLAKELERVIRSISDLPNGKDIKLFGIRSLALAGDTQGWPSQGGLAFLTQKLMSEGNVAKDAVTVERNHITLINGIVYPDARRADFTLTVTSELTGLAANQTITKVIPFSGQIPEAGKLRLIAVNPKIFGKRTISAEFARNGKLTKWGYSAPSRAERMSTFLKEEAAALNTGATDVLTKYHQNQADMATRRANVAKLKTQIITKEGELEVAEAALANSQEASQKAAAAYEAGKTGPDAAALLTAKNTAELAVLTNQNKVKTIKSELEALRNKQPDVEKGLVTL